MGESVGEMMRTKVMVVGPSTGIDDAARFMLQHSISALPVVDERGKVLGLLSKTDIVRYKLGAHPEVGERTASVGEREVQLVFASSSTDDGDQPRVGDVMMPIGFGVGPEATKGEAAQLMVDGRIHRLLVTENNHLVGLVSALDLLPRDEG